MTPIETARANAAAIVLAGGASSRFGADKLAAPLDGRPLLDHALLAVDEVVGTLVIVVAPDAPAPSIPELRSRVLIARDQETFRGPLAGLASGLAALSAAEPPVDLAVLVGGDMPTLVPAVLAQLLDALDADQALGVVLLEAEPMEPLPMAIRPSVVAPAAAALLSDQRRALRGVLSLVPSTVVPAAVWRALDPDGRTVRDVDTPADLPHRKPRRS